MAIEIRIDHDRRTLQVGNYVRSVPQVVNSQVWPKIALDINLENPAMSALELNSEELLSAYREAAIKLWIKPHRKEIMATCLDSSRQVDEIKLINFWAEALSNKVERTTLTSPLMRIRKRVNQEIVPVGNEPALKAEQLAYGDMENVLPILQRIKTTEAKEARAILGKSLWSSVCSNTLEKNVDIVDLIDYLEIRLDHKGLAKMRFLNTLDPEYFIALKQDYIREALADGFLRMEDINFAIHKYEKIVKGAPKGQTFASVIRAMSDIGRMSLLYDGDVRYASNFRPESIFSTHRRYIQEASELVGMDTAKFGALSILEEKLELPSGKAILLNSELMLVNEGVRMSHCIAGYASSCREGRYAAYHLVSNENKHSTIGFWMSDYLPTKMNQHRAPGNRPSGPSELNLKLGHELMSYLEKKTENIFSNKMVAAETAMHTAGNQTDTVDSRMAAVADKLNEMSADGELDASMFLKSDSELESEKNSNQTVQEDMAKGVNAFTSHMLNN